MDNLRKHLFEEIERDVYLSRYQPKSRNHELSNTETDTVAEGDIEIRMSRELHVGKNLVPYRTENPGVGDSIPSLGFHQTPTRE